LSCGGLKFFAKVEVVVYNATMTVDIIKPRTPTKDEEARWERNRKESKEMRKYIADEYDYGRNERDRRRWAKEKQEEEDET